MQRNKEYGILFTNNRLCEKLFAAGVKAAYDEHAKQLLAEKSILAHLLIHTVAEFAGQKPQEVIPLIEPFSGNCVPGISVADVIQGEGTFTYDVRFNVWTGSFKDSEKLLVDVEAQNVFFPGYDLVTRGEFYTSRMLSGQYGQEFSHSCYDELKKVYSIWVCRDVPSYAEETITEYVTQQRNLQGDYPKDKHRYDLQRVVMVGLGKKLSQKKGSIHRLLGILFDKELTAVEKKKLLEGEYDIPMAERIEGRVKSMCNFSDFIEQQGIEKGIEKGVLRKQLTVIRNMLLRNMSDEDIMCIAECDKNAIIAVRETL